MYSSRPDIVLSLASVVASIFLVLALVLALMRIVRGPTSFDRVVALDLIGGVCLCVMVTFAIKFDQEILLDAAFAIALVSFIGTVAFARYLGKGGEK